MRGSWVRAARELLWGVAWEVTEGCSGVETELLGIIYRENFSGWAVESRSGAESGLLGS